MTRMTAGYKSASELEMEKVSLLDQSVSISAVTFQRPGIGLLFDGPFFGGLGALLLRAVLVLGGTLPRHTGQVVLKGCSIQVPKHSLWNWWPQDREVAESMICPKQIVQSSASVWLTA